MLEGLVGVVLLVSGLVHQDLAGTIRVAAGRELRADPGDFVARHVVHAGALAGLHPHRELALGALVTAYAAIKAVLVIAILREARTVVRVGAVAFAAIAATTLVVLVRDPTPARTAVAALDAAVAAVAIIEARRIAWPSSTAT